MQHRLEQSVFRKAKQVHWKSVDGEAVLLQFQSGDYFALDPVGTFLWAKICETPRSFDDLLDALLSEYNCNKQQAIDDVRDFCGQLLAEKLLEIQD